MAAFLSLSSCSALSRCLSFMARCSTTTSSYSLYRCVNSSIFTSPVALFCCKWIGTDSNSKSQKVFIHENKDVHDLISRILFRRGKISPKLVTCQNILLFIVAKTVMVVASIINSLAKNYPLYGSRISSH